MNTFRPRLRRAALVATAAFTAVLMSACSAPEKAPADPKPSSVPSPTLRGVAVQAYYAEAEGRTGEDLKAALHRIISEQETLNYKQVWEALKETDEDPGNPKNVRLLYTGRSQAKGDHGSGADQWNREHVWAKSHGDFGTTVGPGTDIHHLRPTDASVNSTRGNKDFDEGGEEIGEAPGNFTDSDSFEPRDAVKGDVARMLFYMAVRYEGSPDLEVNDRVGNGSKPFIGRLSVLKRWHELDPPDAFEKRRNEVIFEKFQHNRNPFIDRPEWVASIWGGVDGGGLRLRVSAGPSFSFVSPRP